MSRPNPDQKIYFTDSEESENQKCILCEESYCEDDLDNHLDSCVRTQKDIFGAAKAIEIYKSANLIDPN